MLQIKWLIKNIPIKKIGGMFCLLIVLTIMPLQQASAQNGFNGGVTPSRMELQASAGEVIKAQLTLSNLGDRPIDFAVQTNDWLFSEAGQLSFSDNLVTNSCRQWVRLERYQLKVLPSVQRSRNFQFEVHVPDNAVAQECRFALMVSNVGNEFVTNIAQGISLPSSGRVAVLVYVNIGDGKPETKIISYGRLDKSAKNALPFIIVKNTGKAHDRLDSELVATDSSGNSFRLTIDRSAILPGQTRELLLRPQGDALIKVIHYPLNIKGRVFSKTSTISINKVIK